MNGLLQSKCEDFRYMRIVRLSQHTAELEHTKRVAKTCPLYMILAAGHMIPSDQPETCHSNASMTLLSRNKLSRRFVHSEEINCRLDLFKISNYKSME